MESELNSSVFSMDQDTQGVTRDSLGVTHDSGVTIPSPPFDYSLYQISATLLFIVHPALAISGLTTNSMGMLVLVKDGLHKTSNIFLMTLTLADSVCLVGGVSPTVLLQYSFRDGYLGWRFSHTAAYTVYILDSIVFFLVNTGMYVSLTLPAVISAERFFAVYFPLTFKRTMTVKTTLVVILIVCLSWMPWNLFSTSCWSFSYFQLRNNTFVGTPRLSTYCKQHWNTYSIFNVYIFNYLSSIFPMSVVLLGSFLVGVKIKLTRRKRKQLSTNQTSSFARTTRTLMAVSMIFALVNLSCFAVSCVPSQLIPRGSAREDVVNKALQVLIYISSSSNFYVYICFNQKLRNQFLRLFRP